MSFRLSLNTAALFAVALLAIVPVVRCAEPDGTSIETTGLRRGGLREYRSSKLIVVTNLADPQAKAAIRNLESTLKYAAKFWGREPTGQIECYLLQDIEKIADADLPHRLSRVLVGGVGGATISSQTRSRRHSNFLPIILASAQPGVADHELIHAYCTQTFGFTGPCWYREGMAEMVVQRCTRESGVSCTDEQLQQLRDSHHLSLSELLAGDQSGNRIYDSINAMLAHPKNVDRHVPLSDWQQQDADNVTAARKYYLRSWALCYMLLHNPNYSSRFRMLSQKQVTTSENCFATVFASMQDEIAFEYAFFLKNIGNGFRVDLCSWEWNKKFRSLQRGESIAARVDAKKGYQASGLTVAAGTRYRYAATGSWSTSAENGFTKASGTPDGRGRLVGIVLNRFELSEPILFGTDGSFEAPVSGNLYLWCSDSWNELQDNKGCVEVEFSRRF